MKNKRLQQKIIRMGRRIAGKNSKGEYPTFVFTKCKYPQYAGHVAGENAISLNLYYMFHKDVAKNAWILVVLHEIGHIRGKNAYKCKHVSYARMEYNAHRWAWKRAKQFGWNKIADDLKDYINRWTREDFSKNPFFKDEYLEKYNIYVNARKIAIKTGFLKKEKHDRF